MITRYTFVGANDDSLRFERGRYAIDLYGTCFEMWEFSEDRHLGTRLREGTRQVKQMKKLLNLPYRPSLGTRQGYASLMRRYVFYLQGAPPSEESLISWACEYFNGFATGRPRSWGTMRTVYCAAKYTYPIITKSLPLQAFLQRVGVRIPLQKKGPHCGTSSE